MPDKNKITIGNWIKIADYDLNTADAMFRTKRYLYVAFTCQQCIEKLLKGLYVKIKNETPPYTHNLVRLTEITGLNMELDNRELDFIVQLNAYYIKTRYSEQLQNLSKSLNRKKTYNLLMQTKRLATCIKQKIA